MSEPDSGSAQPGARIQVFLIADVRGYSAFTAERGDEAAAALAAKFARIARGAVGESGGRVLELRGDEALAVFPSAREAILAAVELQDRFASETATDPSVPLRVGVGIDAGEAVPFEDGYRGGSLNVAARLCARAEAGEILATRSVVHLAGHVDRVRHTDAGKVRLKGVPGPVETVRILREEGDETPQRRARRRSVTVEPRAALPGETTDLSDLRGRDGEVERIEALLDGARQGISGALVLRGSLGSGTSALLRYAYLRADDMRRVAAAAVETESELAYAGLQLVITPLLEHLDDLIDEHARALRSALLLDDPANAGRLFVGAATLALLGAAAFDRPLLCLIDDAQWLDPNSADALRFAARRLGVEGVVMLFASSEQAERGFPPEGLPTARVEELSAADSLALLHDRFDDRIAPAVASKIVEAAGGNPRELVEIPELLSPRQLAGIEPIVGPIPVSEAHRRAIRRRLEGLSDDAGHALLVASAADTTSMRIVAQTDDSVSRGLAECEEAGLVRLGEGKLVFADPLVRAAAYQAAPAAARRSAHAALASALEDDPLARDRRAWHLAAATVEPDEDVASELVLAASLALERRGHAGAAALFEAASRLSPSRASRDLRAFLAARSWWHAGHREAADRMLQLAGETDDPLLLADVRLLRGRMDLARGEHGAIGRALLDAADEVRPVDPARAAAILAIASDALPADGADPAADRAVSLAADAGGRTELGARLAAARRATARRSFADAADHLARVEQLLAGDRSLASDRDAVLELAIGLPPTVPGASDLLRRLADGTVTTARHSSVVALPHALTRVAWLDLLEGRWDDAEGAFDEAVRLFDETGQGRAAPGAVAGGALVAAVRGHREACVERLEVLRDDASNQLTVEAILGSLELGLGHAEPALEHLERWDADGRASLLPPGWASEVDLVEAAARVRGVDAAASRASQLVDRVDVGLAAWLRALASDADTFQERYDRALEEVASLEPRPFHLARVHLNFGERLRREGLRVEAREHLRRAIETFDVLRATGWSDRARHELEVTGETLGPRGANPLDELTPQELLIAKRLASRMTYKEIAAEQFLSPKTIEFHARKIYRKLGVASKKDLGDLFP